jgi:predicted permease
MRWPRILYMRRRSLFGRPRLEEEMTDELRYHLEEQIRENLNAGMPPDEARRTALEEIGGLDRVKEACRDSRGVTLVENAWRDLRYAWRVLARSPAFLAVAVLSLALSIGANTAIFSFLNAVLLKALPVPEPHRLAIVTRHNDQYGWDTSAFNYPMYRELARRMRAFSGVLAYWPMPVNLTAGNQAERISGELVSGSYFRVLGVRPAIGRLLTDDDDGAEGGHAVCVIGYRLWQERFGGDPRVLSMPILLNAKPFQIVGVSQPGFEGAALQSRHDVQVPMSMTELFMGEKRDTRGWSWMQIVARLAPGVSRTRATAELQAVGTQLDAAKLVPGIGPGANLWKLADGSQGVDWQRGQLRDPVLVLMAAVALLLVIACANMGSLLLARAARRRPEIAMRLALGAARGRIASQLLAESLLLAGIGGAAGWLLSLAMTRLLAAWLAAGSPGVVFRIAPDARVLVFTVAVSLCACLLYGLLPAVQSSRAELLDALKSKPAGGFDRPWARRVLVAAQVALSVVLLLGAGLLARTLRNLQTVDLGFRTERVLMLTVNPAMSGYNEGAARTFLSDLRQRIRRIPGVESVTAASQALLTGDMFAANVHVQGHAPHGEEPNHFFNLVSPDYFRTLGTPLLFGRDFTEADRKGSPPVAIVNQRFATHYWPSGSPLGQHFRWGGGIDVEIVGVVADAHYQNVRDPAPVTAYLPLAQRPFEQVTLMARTGGNPTRLMPLVREQVRALDPKLPVIRMTTLAGQRDADLSRERVLGFLSGLFSLLALLLACIGIYGITAYSVAARTHEVGIRLAMGARRSHVLGLFVREGVLLVALGVAIGVPIALAATRVLASLLFGLPPRDPVTFVACTALLALAGAAASLIPATRAAAQDPARALRHE